NLVVNQTPDIPGVSGKTPICTGYTLQLTSSTTFSGALTYQWTGPDGFTSAEKNPEIPGVSKAAEGTYRLKLTSTIGNCISSEGSTSIVINPTPEITNAIPTGPMQCATATGSITLEGLLSNTIYLVSYKKDGDAEIAVQLSSGTDGKIIIPNLSAGTY